MGKDADQALFLGQAIFDDLITNQEGLYAGFDDVCHRSILFKPMPLAKGSCVSAFRTFGEPFELGVKGTQSSRCGEMLGATGASSEHHGASSILHNIAEAGYPGADPTIMRRDFDCRAFM